MLWLSITDVYVGTTYLGQRGEAAGVVADDLSVGFKFLAFAEYRVNPRSPQRKENDPS